MAYEQVGHKGDPLQKKQWCMSKWDMGGGLFAKKIMVYEQVGHKGGTFAHKPWCTSKWDIRGDPLLKNHGV